MAFSKLTRIVFYVVAGISLLVVLFYYAGPKTLDYDALEMKVDEITNPVDMTPVAPLPEVDSTAQDSTMAGTMEEGSGATPMAEPAPPKEEIKLGEHLSGWESMVWFRTDIALVWAYILLLVTIISSVLFPLIAVFSNRKGLINLVGVAVGGVILVLISYLLSNDTPIQIVGYTGTENSDPQILRMIDTVLFVVYMLFGLSIAAILYSIISKAFK